MADLDTLRPEVRAAMEAMDADVQTLEWLCIRAELLRLARENDEWQTRCLQFQTERDHARQMHADRDVDVQHEWARAEAAEAELAEASETIKRLNRRVQVAEAGVAEKVMRSSGRSFGRSLANAAADMFRRERDEARAELAAIKARMKPCAQVVNGEVRAFMDPDDEGKYVAVVVVEE